MTDEETWTPPPEPDWGTGPGADELPPIVDPARIAALADVSTIGDEIGIAIMDAVRQWDNNRDRSKQSAARLLGMSALGGCREYIRATIAGDPGEEASKLKWAAVVGTFVGEGIERALLEYIPGTKTQARATVTLPSGVVVSGSTDAQLPWKVTSEDGRPNRVIDLKTKDSVDEQRTNGASFKELVQISGYLIGLIQQGELDEDATGHLVYLDRSGRDPRAFVVSVDATAARDYLAAADERLNDVATAISTGQSQGWLRDMPESWCFYTDCPFYKACWDGYQPDDVIDNPEVVADMAAYDTARADAKAAANVQRAVKSRLAGIEGESKEWQLRWKLSQRDDGTVSESIDLRKKR